MKFYFFFFVDERIRDSRSEKKGRGEKIKKEAFKGSGKITEARNGKRELTKNRYVMRASTGRDGSSCTRGGCRSGFGSVSIRI